MINSLRIDSTDVIQEEGYEYFIIDLTLENTKSTQFQSNSFNDIHLKDENYVKYNSFILDVWLHGSINFSIPSKDKLRGEVGFKVPINSPLVLTYCSTEKQSNEVKFKVR